MNLRIRTNFSKEENRSFVYTLFHKGIWVTLAFYDGKCLNTYDSNSFFEAGQKHLTASQEIKRKVDNG